MVFAKNFCIKKINQGDYDYFKEVFELFKLELAYEYNLDKGKISAFSYKNIVSTALNLGELNWTAEFIEKYTPKLEQKEREVQYSYNLARLEFKRKNYDQVVELLHKVDYPDFFLNLSAKSMLLKTYYELDEYDPMYYLMDSMRVYINRQRGLSYHKTLYMNFLRVLKKLSNTRVGDQDRCKKLLREVDQKQIVDAPWLREKIMLVGDIEDMVTT